MGIDHCLEVGEFFLGGGTVKAHLTSNPTEPRTHPFGCAEESAQIQFSCEAYRHVTQGDTQGVGMQSISDFLAGSERCQGVFDRVGGLVLTAESRRFVNFHAEVANFDFAVQPGLADL